MDYSLACQTLNYAGKLGLNDGRFAFIMFDLDFDPTGNKRKTLSGLFQKNWDVAAFQSALVLAVDNKVNAEYLTFMDNVKTNSKSSGPPFIYPVNLEDKVSVLFSEKRLKVGGTHDRRSLWCGQHHRHARDYVTRAGSRQPWTAAMCVQLAFSLFIQGHFLF